MKQGNICPREYKHMFLALQVKGDSNLREKVIFTGPQDSDPRITGAGEDQQ
jgi:hypothetical protein